MKQDTPLFMYMLQTLFIGLYLTGHIAHWSLWWVLAPLWGYYVLTVGIGVVLGVMGFALRWLKRKPTGSEVRRG